MKNFFRSRVIVAFMSISTVAVGGATLRAQVVTPTVIYSPEQTTAGITIRADTHTIFSCPAGQPQTFGLYGNQNAPEGRYWLYEYKGGGHEPQKYEGRALISEAELTLNPRNASRNTMTEFIRGKKYYAMTAKDLKFKCGDGLSTKENATLSIIQKNIGESTTVTRGQKNVNLLRFEAHAQGGDIRATGFKFAPRAGSALNAHNYTLFVDTDGDGTTEQVLAEVASFKNPTIHFNDIIGNGFIIPEGKAVAFEVHADINEYIQSGELQLEFRSFEDRYVAAQHNDSDEELLGIRTNQSCISTCQIDVETTPSVVAKIASCGNGKVEGSEQCDDGNREANDGCTESCIVEDAFQCSPNAQGRHICQPIIPTLGGQSSSTHSVEPHSSSRSSANSEYLEFKSIFFGCDTITVDFTKNFPEEIFLMRSDDLSQLHVDGPIYERQGPVSRPTSRYHPFNPGTPIQLCNAEGTCGRTVVTGSAACESAGATSPETEDTTAANVPAQETPANATTAAGGGSTNTSGTTAPPVVLLQSVVLSCNKATVNYMKNFQDCAFLLSMENEFLTSNGFCNARGPTSFPGTAFRNLESGKTVKLCKINSRDVCAAVKVTGSDPCKPKPSAPVPVPPQEQIFSCPNDTRCSASVFDGECRTGHINCDGAQPQYSEACGTASCPGLCGRCP